jgi:hypothetical protein
MSCSEHDGPPVTPPLSKGFGRVVIEQMAAQSLSASVSLEFPQEGVHWTIHMPVSVIQKSDSPIPAVLHPREPKDRRVRQGTRETES